MITYAIAITNKNSTGSLLVLTEYELEALFLSLKIASVAVIFSLPLGIGCAWLLARRQFWGKSLLDGLIHLPLVLLHLWLLVIYC